MRKKRKILLEAEIKEIKETYIAYHPDFDIKALSKKYDVCRSTVASLIRPINSEIRRKFGKLTFCGVRHHKSKLTPENVIQIRDLFKAGFSPEDLAEKFHISYSNINFIINRTT